MSNGTDKTTDTGLLSKTGAHKSVLATMLDLYKNDLAFRGMTDFAAIGAVVMMFLSPPSGVTWPWSSGGGTGAGYASNSNTTPTSTSTPGSVATGLVLPIVYPQWVANPSNNGIIFDIDAAAFASSSAADRPRLAAARLALSVNRSVEIAEILREATGTDRNVAFMRGLGLMLRNTPADNAASQALLQSASASGNTAAGGMLGWLALGTRPGVTLTKDDGQRLIEAAAAAGDRQAMRLAAIAYISGGFGRLDPPKARDLARKAADAGDAPAMLLYSRLLADSLGGPGDGKAAESYLRKAAAAGLTTAQFVLAKWLWAQYEKGLVADPKEAIALMERSYQNGHYIAALTDLMYFHSVAGKVALYLDPRKAFEYAQKCAGFQDQFCQFNNGAALGSGSGGIRDLVRARAHYAVARGLNYAPAAERINQIEVLMSAADRQASTQYETLLRSQLKPLPVIIQIQYPGADFGAAPIALAPDRPNAGGQTAIPGSSKTTATTTTGFVTGQTGADDAQCRNSAVANDTRIAACNRVIQTHLDKKQWPDVIRMATEGLGWAPNNTAMLEARAKAYAERGGTELDLALADYNDLVRRGIKTPAILTGRGRVYESKGEAFLDKAVDDYTLAVSLGGHSDLPHYYRAKIRFDRGQYADAIADLNQAINEHKVGDAFNYWLRGRAKLELSDYDGAEADFTKEIEAKPDDASGYYWRGLTRTNQIIALLDRCAQENKRDTRRGELTGGPCARPMPYSDALQDLNKAIDRNSNLANAHHTAGRLLNRWGRPEEALKAFAAAIAANSKSSNSMIQIGIIYLDQLKNEKAALQKFNEAIAAEPSNGLGYSNRANVLARYPASRQQAIADFRRALELDRTDAYSKNGLRRLGVNP